MKKINNLKELVELIGMESVEKCFTEYMMLIIAKAKRYDENLGLNIKSNKENLSILEEDE